jgi:transcriptional regulator with XRE-family HTH domain
MKSHLAGQKLRVEIARRGWTFSELARRAGISASYARWIGKGAQPSKEMLAKITKAFDDDPSESDRFANPTEGNLR